MKNIALASYVEKMSCLNIQNLILHVWVSNPYCMSLNACVHIHSIYFYINCSFKRRKCVKCCHRWQFDVKPHGSWHKVTELRSKTSKGHGWEFTGYYCKNTIMKTMHHIYLTNDSKYFNIMINKHKEFQFTFSTYYRSHLLVCFKVDKPNVSNY